MSHIPFRHHVNVLKLQLTKDSEREELMIFLCFLALIYLPDPEKQVLTNVLHLFSAFLKQLATVSAV